MPQNKPATSAPPVINPGERAIAAGRSGSGKSTMACYLLKRSPGHWIIINPKHTKAFNNLPDSVTLTKIDTKEISKQISEHRFVIINPPSSQAEPEMLDALVLWLHETFTDIGICVDELYTLHTNGKAGPGLIGWLTRGREMKQSFFGLTQRPAWISKFLFSESNFIVGMSLNLQDDRKRMHEFTGREQFKDKLEPRKWLWYDVDKDNLRQFGAVPID